MVIFFFRVRKRTLNLKETVMLVFTVITEYNDKGKPLCDKCRTPVPDRNNAAYVGLYAGNATCFTASARHLLPWYDIEGEKSCEGSPSTAQYLEGQPRDVRPGSVYHNHMELFIREGYRLLQEACAKEEHERYGMSEEEVAELMRKSRRVDEWSANVEAIKHNCHGIFPPFWFRVVYLTGLQKEIFSKFPECSAPG
ncbi:MAG: hypothetical protein JWN37_847 [Candidatus Nomurabacteria bacterium]|nr:hypothetical protein [Candidatus Nomurabacteria bacterium]